MELAEQIDPEEWHRILDRFFQILADGVQRRSSHPPGPGDPARGESICAQLPVSSS